MAADEEQTLLLHHDHPTLPAAAAAADHPCRHGRSLTMFLLLKRTTIVILRNLHHLLYLAALIFLLSHLLITSFSCLTSLLSHQFNSFINSVFLTYMLTGAESNASLTYSDFAARAHLHELNPPSPAAAAYNISINKYMGGGRRLCFKLLFVVFSITNVMADVQEAAKVVAVCRDFGLVAVVVSIGGAMYAAHRLRINGARLMSIGAESADVGDDDGDGGKMEEVQIDCSKLGGGNRNSSRAAACMIGLQGVSTWVSGVAFAITFIWWASSGSTGLGCNHNSIAPAPAAIGRHGCFFTTQADLLMVIGALVVGVSVMGFPALLYAGILSTKVALDISSSSSYQ